jgi:beta-1,4-mannosyltransferase
MQYHALALASSLADVDLVGYAGSAPHHSVREHAHITCHFLRPPWWRERQRLPRLLFLGAALLNAFRQTCQLLWALLFTLPKPDFVLVQNPPAIPTLFLAWGVARLRSAKLVVDWHNFGYTMLALRIGQHHPIVRLALWHERALGRWADAHLCVSQAMREELCVHWGISDVTVLYDRPATVFVPTPLPQRQALYRRLREEIHCPLDASNRPAVIVSPTSWTADEDFSILLEAVVQYEALIDARTNEVSSAASAGRPFPRLCILMTGKGPLREYYEEQIARLALRTVSLHTLWLSAEDYPLLLGAADLGLCFHRSSSGFDLPMKVADMFGAGLPVCALDYGPCLTEQVRHGENGLLFSTSAQLAQQLYELFAGFPEHTPLLDHLRRYALASGGVHWEEEWRMAAQPLFSRS